MRAVSKDTITDAFLGYCADTKDERLLFVLSRLAAHLHDFAKEVSLTHEEWGTAIDFLFRAGKISTPERNEFILLSDVLGLSSLVDMINTGSGGTESSVLGPFHIADAPMVAVGGDVIGENDGDPVVVSGRVLSAGGESLPGALLDVWQTAPNGLYSNQDPEQDRWNLRFRMHADEAGRYAFTTVRPCPYTVPDDGPVGDLLRATGRHPWRPAHFHFIISADGHSPLVTELFPKDDPYIEQDAVFGVRDTLSVDLQPMDTLEGFPIPLTAAGRLKPPFFRVDFDFSLVAA